MNQVKNIINVKYEIIPLTLTLLLGVTISILPRLIMYFQNGDFAWFADNDDVLYLAFASTAYHNHWWYIGDPVVQEKGASLYSLVQFLPGIIFAKIAQLNPAYINLFWRFLRGGIISTSWYFLFRLYIKNPWLCFAGSAILMTDIGVISSTLFYKHWLTATNIAVGNPGTLFEANPRLLSQWRIMTPAMSLGYLLLQIILLSLALKSPTKTRIILSGIGYGLLFYVYFYFWTAATVALVISSLVDKANRRIYLIVVGIGILIGIPDLLIKSLIKKQFNNDYLTRNNMFVDIPNFSNLLIPKVALILCLLTLVWILLKKKELFYIWALAFSALLLTNHQILTGIDLQNFHWNYCYGPLLSFLIIVFILDSITKWDKYKRQTRFLLTFVVALYITTGLWFRFLESTQSSQPMELTRDYLQFKNQIETVDMKPRQVVAGDRRFVEFAMVDKNLSPLSGYVATWSPTINNQKLDERMTLNSYILGADKNDFVNSHSQYLGYNFMQLPIHSEKSRIQNRIEYYDQIDLNPAKAIENFGITYIALPSDLKTPEYISQEKDLWKLISSGPKWQVWERQTQS